MQKLAGIPRSSIEGPVAPPAQDLWPGKKGTGPEQPGRGRRVATLAFSILMAAVIGALALHLLAEIISHFSRTDPLGLLSMMAGTAMVLVTLLPFTLLCIHRAQHAWAAVLAGVPPRSDEGCRRQ